MTITINGNGTIGGVSVGGLPDGIVDTDMLASAAVEQAKLASGVVGTGPVFFATANSVQSISAGTWTKVSFANEVFDTNNNFSSSRFTPTIAGYYQINASIYYGSNPSGQAIAYFYKNGNDLMEFGRNVATGQGAFSGGIVVYANGSTDYFEVYFHSSGSNTLSNSTNTSYVSFSGALVRST